MTLLRILVIAILGSTAAPSFALPVQFTLEQDPFISWDYAFRNGDGRIVSGVVPDDDGDGLATFVADVDPVEPDGYLHSSISMMICLVLLLEPGHTEGPIPLILDSAGNPLIVESIGAPTGPFTLGQTLSATDGIITGLNGVLHENPGIPNAAALLASDVSALPNYGGGAVVGALISYEVLPEPASWLLLLGGAVAIAGRRQFRGGPRI